VAKALAAKQAITDLGDMAPPIRFVLEKMGRASPLSTGRDACFFGRDANRQALACVSFRLHQLGDGPCKLCGGTRHAGSSLWVSDRIDSNRCGITADLSENRRARIPKICEATVLEKSIVWTFTHGAISNDGRQIVSISSVTGLHGRTRIDNRAKFVARCGPYGNGFC
jgi:hypothetical protein